MASTSDANADDHEAGRIRSALIGGITGSWEKVVNIYEEEPRAHKIKISRSGNTALHTAVESKREETVEQLVKLITKSSSDPVNILSMGNEDGNTPLHLAASLGNLPLCKCITGDGKYKQLLGSQNKHKETPLSLAACHGKKDAFLLLYEMCDETQVHDYCVIADCKTYYFSRESYGETVLGYAITGGHFDLAFQIIHMEDLMDYFDRKRVGVNSLFALAYDPTTFRSGIYLSLFEKIIYNRKYNKHLDTENPTEGQDHFSGNGAPGPQQPPSNYCRCLRSIKLIISKALLLILSTFLGSSEIRKKKERNIWALRIMNKLIERAARYSHQMNPPNQAFRSEYEYFVPNEARTTPILVAASNGIVEMVEKILQVFPMTIHDTDYYGKNIVLLAVENRQSHVYDFLLKSSHLLDKDLAFHAEDRRENNALDLASNLKDYESWLIPSSMLQMQWEVKWYEYVKNSLPSNLGRSNYIETPDWNFAQTHKELLENSKAWLNSTCNSCSFIAALIATVTFASAATVPGGVNQDTGKPMFQHHLAFRFFAMSSLVALCSSFISLLIFFALLTSKCQYKDFSKNVPRNLFFGLTSLFISMAAMLSCFISGHFLMLDSQLKYYGAVPVYAVTFLVITFLSLQQLPSYVVLVRATFQKVPQRIYKEGTL